MRAEECAGEYMSPLVKQDLAKTGKDGESRRVPSHALSQEVEKLELGSIPQFLAQVRLYCCSCTDHRPSHCHATDHSVYHFHSIKSQRFEVLDFRSTLFAVSIPPP